MMHPDDLIAGFVFHPGRRDRFRDGHLWREWADRYPGIFDEDDRRIAETQAQQGFHFFEWLAAVLLYESLGYLCLVEQYQFASHKRKRCILERLFVPDLLDFVARHEGYGHVQCPDLLVYAPDFSYWFFCEVKGPGDLLSPGQMQFFEALEKRSGRSVRLIRFTPYDREGTGSEGREGHGLTV